MGQERATLESTLTVLEYNLDLRGKSLSGTIDRQLSERAFWGNQGLLEVNKRNFKRKGICTKFAKTTVIIRTLDPSLLRVGIQAFIPRRAITILGEPPTFWHTPQIVFMKEFTCISFLT